MSPDFRNFPSLKFSVKLINFQDYSLEEGGNNYTVLLYLDGVKIIFSQSLIPIFVSV